MAMDPLSKQSIIIASFVIAIDVAYILFECGDIYIKQSWGEQGEWIE